MEIPSKYKDYYKNVVIPQLLAERDMPSKKDLHSLGCKDDAEKTRMSLIFNNFASALEQVAKVGTFGARKYTDNGWCHVEDGVNRYTDALYRHLLAEAQGEVLDSETELWHSAHAAWNALARLELQLRNIKGL
jgi:hypothetical protein